MLSDKRLEANGAAEAWKWSATYGFITCVSLHA